MMQANERIQSENGGKRGRLFVVSAPSGTGKTTLCTALRERFPDLSYSISYTTRSPRKGEKDGRDYFFISLEEFRAGIDQGRWVEWAEVHGNYYGTSAFALEKTLSSGGDLLLEIDVQGMRQILERFPEAVTIFILPPSVASLRERLFKRGTDASEVIERRIADAILEIARKDAYRYRIVNDDFERARDALLFLIDACRKYEDPDTTDFL
ncbi:guanylate kinase [Desulfobotulus sp. H1]|uniref:Guanylate kinase n=1 Tax=Desulfobotulus pelophilus TaxID=2823377 RepID=A0ABT3N9Q5_9BACT|nr:guanylate kinase [Desulfobotulus pelophilus]MCW7754184.1 guanylate kinase [Desulfobotulus pelophilus]